MKVDRQGRLVIPAPLRAQLGVLNGGEVVIRVSGRRLILEAVDRELEKRVEEAVARALRIRSPPMVEEPPEGVKWYDPEYAKRKLGL